MYHKFYAQNVPIPAHFELRREKDKLFHPVFGGKVQNMPQ